MAAFMLQWRCSFTFAHFPSCPPPALPKSSCAPTPPHWALYPTPHPSAPFPPPGLYLGPLNKDNHGWGSSRGQLPRGWGTGKKNICHLRPRARGQAPQRRCPELRTGRSWSPGGRPHLRQKLQGSWTQSGREATEAYLQLILEPSSVFSIFINLHFNLFWNVLVHFGFEFY